jgi:hypothetical protein
MTTIETLPTFTRDAERVRMVHTAEGGWTFQKGENGLFKRSAKNYRITSPEAIGRELEANGFKVERCLSLFSHGAFEPRHERRASPWKYGLEVAFPADGLSTMASMDPTGDDSAYRLRARILLANNGREALKIALGALRLNCTNQFTACLMSIRHTDAEIDGFLTDPAGWLFDARGHAEAAVKNLHALRGLAAPRAFLDAVDTSPRLSRRFKAELWRYHREELRQTGQSLGGPDTFWSLAQALTGTRSPRLVRASMHLLQASPEALSAGACPNYFKVLAAKN